MNPVVSKPQDNITTSNDVMKKKYVNKIRGQPNTALLSAILLFGTCMVAFYMRKIRHSHLFGKQVSGVFIFSFSLFQRCLSDILGPCKDLSFPLV